MNEMEELFEKWKHEIASDHFVKDGIINNKHWEGSSKKILFILKETNNYKGNIAKLIEISVGKKTKLWARPTFHNVGRWAYGLLHYDSEKPPYKLAHKNRKDSLLFCSFINIKKTSGGRAATHAVEDHADKYAHFLRKQITILNPNIIVFGGTYAIVKKHVIPELNHVSERVHLYGDIICINANHPACTKKRTTMYDQVIRSYDRYLKL